MFLVNSCLGLFTAACFPSGRLSLQVCQAPLLPKLRGHFAEFLSQSYPVGLKFLTLSTCVGLQYGRWFSSIEVFLGSVGSAAYARCTYPSGLTFRHADFPACPCYALRKAIPSAFPHTFLRHSISQSVHSGTGILTCFPFAFAALLMLRSRLPQGGQTFPWKPWTSGRRDSRPPSRYSFLHSRF